MVKARQVWSKENCRGNLDISADGLQILYRGSVGQPDEQAKMAGSARAIFPFPQTGCWYFEIKVLNPGDTGIIGIGLMEKESRLSDMPGWGIFTNDYGYHADDASIVTHAIPVWTVNDAEFDGRFTKDDIVGCGVHWDSFGGSIFFTKNGTLIAAPVYKLEVRNLYPSVGILSSRGEIRANFGTEGERFVFDLTSYAKSAEESHKWEVGVRRNPECHVWENIPEPPEGESLSESLSEGDLKSSFGFGAPHSQV